MRTSDTSFYSRGLIHGQDLAMSAMDFGPDPRHKAAAVLASMFPAVLADMFSHDDQIAEGSFAFCEGFMAGWHEIARGAVRGAGGVYALPPPKQVGVRKGGRRA